MSETLAKSAAGPTEAAPEVLYEVSEHIATIDGSWRIFRASMDSGDRRHRTRSRPAPAPSRADPFPIAHSRPPISGCSCCPERRRDRCRCSWVSLLCCGRVQSAGTAVNSDLRGGGRPVRVSPATAGSAFNAVWSPDGRQIAFGAGNGVYVVGATGGTPRRIARRNCQLGDWQSSG